MFRKNITEVVVWSAVLLLVHVVVVSIVYAVYLEQSPAYYFDYIRSAFEIASGYSKFMRAGDRRWSLIGYLAITALIFAWHVRLLQAAPARPGGVADSASSRSGGAWRAVVLACYAAPVLFIAMKQGYTRQDGHEVASYIVAFAYASLVAGSTRIPGGVLVPVQAVAALGVALAIHATQAQDLRAGANALRIRLSESLSRATGTLSLLSERARAAASRVAEDRNRAALDSLHKAMPLVAQFENYDIFAPEQALAAVNPGQYSPRPIFQGYSAYTAILQDLNARYVEHVPDQFLVDFQVIDGRYPNLEDGSTLAQIAMQFCPEDWYGSHVSVRRTEPHVELADLEELDWRSDGLLSGDPVALPGGVVLGRVGVKLTWLGHAAAAIYRLPALVARFDLSDGRILHARLIPTGRRYPAIVSPLLANTGDLASLWAGAPPQSEVTRVQFSASPILKLLIKDLTLRHAVVDWPAIARKCASAPTVADPPPPGSTVYEVPRGGRGLHAIDAHPNRTIAVAVSGAAHLRATLRLRSPERTLSRSDGVEVRIYVYRSGIVTPVMERRIAADEFRSSPSVTVFDGALAADGGYLVFETRDRNSAWDWFEWEHIVVD